MTATAKKSSHAQHKPGMKALLGIAAYIVDAARNRYVEPSTVLMHVAHDVGALCFPERKSSPRTLRFAERAAPLIAAPELLSVLKAIVEETSTRAGNVYDLPTQDQVDAARAVIAKAEGGK